MPTKPCIHIFWKSHIPKCIKIDILLFIIPTLYKVHSRQPSVCLMKQIYIQPVSAAMYEPTFRFKGRK